MVVFILFCHAILSLANTEGEQFDGWLKGLQWQSIKGGFAIDVGASSRNVVYIVSNKNRLYRWKADLGWQLLPGYFKRVAVDQEHKPWAIDNDNLIRRYNGLWWDIKGQFQAVDIAASINGKVVALGLNGQPYRWEATSLSWLKVEMVGHDWQADAGLRITIDSNDMVWVVLKSGNIIKQAESHWQSVTGSALDISAGPQASILIIGDDGIPYIGSNTETVWTALPDLKQAIGISIGENGSPWVVNNQGALITAATLINQQEAEYGQNGPEIATDLIEAENNKDDITRAGFIAITGNIASTTKERFLFKQIPNSAGKDIEIGPDGSVFILGPDGEVQRWQNNRNRFVTFPGVLKRISVDPYGMPWGINAVGEVYRHTDGNWKLIRNIIATDISIGLYGQVYVTNNAENVFRYNVLLDKFERVDGIFGTQIAVGPDKTVWLIRQDGRIYQCDGRECEYRNKRDGKDVAIGPEGSVFVTSLNADLYQWQKADKRWVKKFDKARSVSVGPSGYPWVIDSGNQVWRTVFFDRDESEDLILAQKTISTTLPTTTSISTSAITITKRVSFTNVSNPASTSDINNLLLSSSANKTLTYLLEKSAAGNNVFTWVNTFCLNNPSAPACHDLSMLQFCTDNPAHVGCQSCNISVNQGTALCTAHTGSLMGSAWTNGFCLINPSALFCPNQTQGGCGNASCLECNFQTYQTGTVCVQLGNGGISSSSNTSSVWESTSTGSSFKSFSKLPNENTQWIIVAEDGRHWTIDDQNNVYRETTAGRGHYTLIPGTQPSVSGGSIRQVAAGGSEVYALNDAYEVFRYDAAKKRFYRYDSNNMYRRIAVDPQGNLWALNQSKEVKRFQDDVVVNVPKTQLKIAEEIAIGADGSVFIFEVVGPNRQLQKYSAANDRFDVVKSNITNPHQLTVDNIGRPWIVTTDPKIYHAR